MSDEHAQFSVHNEPAWRERANFVVNAVLPEPDRYEQLWCRRVGDDEFEVCCIPFFLYDIALGDVVQTSPQRGRMYVVSGVKVRSGRYVFRAFFEPSMWGSREGVANGLSELGGLLEWSSASLLAADARDFEHAQQLAGYLFEQQNLGRVVYETGRSA